MVNLTYAALPEWQGQAYVIKINGQKKLQKVVDGTGDWYEYGNFLIGEVQLPVGRHHLSLAPAQELKNNLMYFQQLCLQLRE